MRRRKYKNKLLKNSILEIEKDFHPINTSINDWVNSKKELTKKRTFTKNIFYDQYDWLINYIPEPIKTSGC